jgi:hypothetical protein
MRWIIAVVVLLSIFSCGTAFAASPSIDDIKVFNGYQETDDWLIVVTYNISGGNTSDCTNTSCCSSVYPWRIQLIDNAGSTIITDNSIDQCGMCPASIPRSAAQASLLVSGGNYSVKIYGAWGATPNASRAINASTDWLGTNLKNLDKWVKNQADIIGTHDGKDYLTTVPIYGDVLTAEGGNIFNTGIPYLSSYRPDIFQETIVKVPISYVNSTQDTTYATDLYNNWDTTLGPEVSAVLTDSGYYFGLNGRLMGALLTILGFISLAMIEKSVAFMIILGGVLIGVFHMGTILLIVFLLLIVLVRSLFWSSV